MLQGKSSTVSDNEDIKPLVKSLGETKVNFESDVLLSLAVETPRTPEYQGYKTHFNLNVTLQKISHRQVR